MASLLPVEEAQRLALAPVRRLGPERVALPATLGRVLAEEVIAPADVPPHDNSAMDGYALRAADGLDGAELRVIGELFAGQVATRPLAPGEAWRIMTGAPIPPGADAVVMQEETERRGDRVLLRRQVRPGDHLRPRGEDLQVGQSVLPPGVTLGPAEIGLLASTRRSSLLVTRAPTVAVLVTGDELRDLDQPLDPGAIADSNGYTLAALVRQAGGVPFLQPLVRDEPARLRDAITAAQRADLIVSSGGVSVGERDYVQAVLTELGATISAWRVDMKPGKPVTLAVLDGTPYYGLPGNPASAQVAFTLFVRPAIRAALGCREPFDLPRATAELEAPLRARAQRRNYLRARLRFGEGRLRATALSRQGSGLVSSMAGANGLIVLPPGEHALSAGEPVDALITGPLAG